MSSSNTEVLLFPDIVGAVVGVCSGLVLSLLIAYILHLFLFLEPPFWQSFHPHHHVHLGICLTDDD